MDYKEKYEQALTYVEDLVKHNVISKENAGKYFPELAEPEDERVRKGIIELVKQSSEVLDKQNQNNMLAWLEKQGEPQGKSALEAAKEEKIDNQNCVKPADKPKFKVKYAGGEYNVLEVKDIAGVTYYGIEDEPNHIDYVQAENCERVDGYNIKENGSPYPTKSAVFSEQKPTDEDMKEALRTEYEKGRADAIAQMQKEWSEDDNHEYFSELLENDNSDNIDDYAYQCAYCMSHDWMKDTATWDDVQKACKLGAEWKKKHRNNSSTDWSEEDRDYYDAIITKLEVTQDDTALTDNQMEFLKSLKDRVYLKQEWSEEDETKLKSACALIRNTSLNGNEGIVDSTITFLKSLKNKAQPQNTWKPSEGQLECLGYAIEKAEKDWSPLMNNRIYLTLKELKRQLEKL